MRLKPGVRVLGLQAGTLLAMQVAAEVLRGRDIELVITSVIDGGHSRGSKHYSGNAFDFRIRHMAPSQPEQVRDELSKALAGDYDVVLERDHIHVEYDPKTAY